MAQYQSVSRTNYFKVHDPEAFGQFCRRYGFEVINDKGQVGFLAAEGLPDTWENPETEETEEVNVIEELQGLLAEDSVAILMEIGREKMRYFNGVAIALTRNGYHSLTLNGIYDLAAKQFNVSRTQITSAAW